jgi:uncharacterized protein
MRKICQKIAILSCLSALLPTPWRAEANPVPDLIPNVVDESQTLSSEDQRAINDALKEIRKEADIYGAVLIVKKLEDDTIETLAEKTFRKWKLGRAKDDNGLLLLLSLDDRRSRFEVGYGLEGDLPDLIAKRALDRELAPLMRDGKTKDAIIAAFRFMADVKLRKPNQQATLDDVARDLAERRVELACGSATLLISFLTYFGVPFTVRRRARRLAAQFPPEMRAQIDQDPYLRGRSHPLRRRVRNFLLLSLFFPTMFVLGCYGPVVVAATSVAAGIFWLVTRNNLNRYVSSEAYLAFIEAERNRYLELLQRGHVHEVAPGYYAFTEAYYESVSASSDSSYDSSSGGGSSGGGGASSSW